MMLHRPHENLDEQRLRIVITASEAVPWSKTGGLADVSTALAKSLAEIGHDVTLIVPYHRQSEQAPGRSETIHDTGISLEVPVGKKVITGNVFWTRLRDSDVRVVLIDQKDYFQRPHLYQDSAGDYPDNCERFVFFSRAALDVVRSLVLRPHVIHANDWQTGLIPALLEIEKRGTPGFEETRCVFTIHNLAYQGWFWHLDMPLTGIGWEYFNLHQMECHEQLNLLKTGIAFADQITTVSPRYAREIQSPEFGCGQDRLLVKRGGDLTGILNGIDSDTWNPETDPYLVANYNVDSFPRFKPECKAHLQQSLGLPLRREVPVFGMVSRMTDQKGFDLITQAAKSILEQDVQLVFLGSGEARYESMFAELAAKHPDNVATSIGFDEQLAHEIEAGSDFYLMPSRFEPCGLNQMYSLAYGTVPLVRAVGGLADSVVDVNARTLDDDSATGIVFEDYDANSFFAAFKRCTELYADTQAHAKVIRAGMLRDSTWERSAEEYVSVYRRAISRNPASV